MKYNQAGIVRIRKEPKPQNKFTMIHYEKVVINHAKRIKIIGFGNVRRCNALPKEYTDSVPCYCLCAGKQIHVFVNDVIHIIEIGSCMTVPEFDNLIRIMRKAGERLGKILQEDLNQHTGRHVVTI